MLHSPTEHIAESANDQYLGTLVFLSYRYSQGGIGTQNRMLLHIEEQFHPSMFTGDKSTAVHEVAHKMIGKYFLDQSLHPATALPWEDDSPEAAIKSWQLVTNELTGLFERFRKREQIADFDSDIVGIAQSVIMMDADYLRRPGGRAGDSEDLKIVVSPYRRDAYDSLFIKYAILGTSTNTIEFDEIFSSLANEDVLRQFDAFSLRQLKNIIAKYVEMHPETDGDRRITAVSSLCAELLDAR